MSNTPPFPSRDGVTVVSSHYAEAFKARGDEIDLLLLEKPGEMIGEQNENYSRFGNVYSLSITRFGKIRACIAQLFGGMPYFSAWKLRSSVPASLSDLAYDVIWATPRSTIPMVDDLRSKGLIRGKTLIGGVNDIASLRLVKMGQAGSSFAGTRGVLKRYSYRLQGAILWRSERRMLSKCDLVHVQTDEELNWVRGHCDSALEERFFAQVNGVDDALFNLSMSRQNRSIVFVGALDGMYADRVRWFIEQVLPIIRVHAPDVQVYVVGRCSDSDLVEWLRRHGVNYQNFVDDICELYAAHSILVAPIFKGYGLINKVVQSMAAGTLVVGDVTAFNGIEGFTADKHGLVATSADEFAKKIILALESPSLMEEIRLNARHLVSDSLRWNLCAETVVSELQKIESKQTK